MNSRVSRVIAVQLGHRGGNSSANEEERPFSSLPSCSIPEKNLVEPLRAIRVRTAYATLTRVLLVELLPVLFRRRLEFLVIRSLSLLRSDRVSENIVWKIDDIERRRVSVLLYSWRDDDREICRIFVLYYYRFTLVNNSFTLAKRIDRWTMRLNRIRFNSYLFPLRAPVICLENADENFTWRRDTLKCWWLEEEKAGTDGVCPLYIRIYIYIYLPRLYRLKSKVVFRPRIPAYVNIIPIYFTARVSRFLLSDFSRKYGIKPQRNIFSKYQQLLSLFLSPNLSCQV